MITKHFIHQYEWLYLCLATLVSLIGVYLAFIVCYHYFNHDEVFLSYSFNDLFVKHWADYLYFSLHNSLTPTLLTALMLSRVRFASRYANVLFAFVVMSAAVTTLGIVDSDRIAPIFFFILLNNCAFLPFVFALSTAGFAAADSEYERLSGTETDDQNRRYVVTALCLSAFGGIIAGVLSAGVFLIAALVRFDAEAVIGALIILFVTTYYGALTGTIPAIVLAWIVVVFRLQRNANGVLMTLLSGLSLATIYGALAIYMEKDLSANQLSLFMIGGAGVSGIVAFFLPQATPKQAQYGISSPMVRKRLGMTLFLGTTISVLLVTTVIVCLDPASFYHMGHFDDRALLSLVKKILDISVITCSFLGIVVVL